MNTRIGWYSRAVTSGTGDGGAVGFDADSVDSAWSGAALVFPRIQGADACGRIVEVGAGVPDGRIGERVLVRNMLRTPVDYRPFECWTLGSECDGGFAQLVVAPARETYAVRSDLSDAELAAVPCACGPRARTARWTAAPIWSASWAGVPSTWSSTSWAGPGSRSCWTC